MAKSTESSQSSPYRLNLPPADSFFFSELDVDVLVCVEIVLAEEVDESIVGSEYHLDWTNRILRLGRSNALVCEETIRDERRASDGANRFDAEAA